MPPRTRPSALALLLCLGLATPTPPARADAHGACTGFVDSVPATIAAPGVWCLRRDLATAITSGNAITLAADGVVLDCNGFKLGGLAAGSASGATGIGSSRRNAGTVRRCNVRGFLIGLNLDNGGGHLVENNRFDGNLFGGIRVNGTRNIVRRNQVYNTGGAAGGATSYGLFVGDADVIDNLVAGVFAVQADTSPTGINAFGGRLIRNRVRGLVVNGAGVAYGIFGNVPGRIQDNHVVSGEWLNGFGIALAIDGDAQCRGNTVGGFATAIRGCADIGGNAVF